MQKLVFRNSDGEEIDFTSGDFGVTKWKGFSKVDMEVQSQQVPFHDGSVFLDALLGERELSVTVAVNDDGDLEKRYRLKRELIHCLNPKLGEGELIYTNDYTSKKIVCVPDIPEFDNKNMNDSGTMKAMCSFTASDPYWEDVEETMVSFIGDHIQTIENTGDVKVPLIVDVVSNNLEDFTIRNISNNEKLEFRGGVSTGFLRTSSKMGKKTCMSLEIKKEIFCGVKFNSATELNKKIYFFSDDYIFKSYDGTRIDELLKNEHGVKACCADVSNNRIVCVSEKEGKFKLGYYSGNDVWTDFNFVETNGHIYSIAVSGGIICAVGYRSGSGTQYFILTSTDNGETWAYTDTTETWNICKYFEGIGFVIGGFNGDVWTSNDGTTWTVKTSLPNVITDMAEFNGAIYAVSMGLYKSTDSMDSWEQNTSVGGLVGFIASSDFLGIMVTTGSKVFKSKNGEAFESVDLKYTIYQIIWVSYLSEFIIAGDALLYSMGSLDFYTLWEPCFPRLFYGINGICYNNKDEVAVGQNYTAKKIENNKWQYQNIGKTFNKVIFTDGYNGYYATATDGIYFSSDGLNWEQKLNNGNITDIGYLPKSKVLIAVASTYKDYQGETYNYGVVWESGNGTDWTPRTFNNSLLGLSILDIDEDSQSWKAIAVGENGQVVVRERNGHWEARNLSSGRTMRCACKYENRVFIFGNDGYYATAELKNVGQWDWSEGQVAAHYLGDSQTVTITSWWYRVKYIESLGLYVMVGSRYILYSFNCTDWIILDVLTMSLDDFIYNEYLEEFIFVGSNYSSPFLERRIFEESQNEINKLSEESNLNFGLDIGENNIQLIKQSGNGKLLIHFSQKYLGV